MTIMKHQTARRKIMDVVKFKKLIEEKEFESGAKDMLKAYKKNNYIITKD